MKRFLSALAIGALSLSACDSVAPDTGASPTSAFASAASQAGTSPSIEVPLALQVPDRHLVLFSGNGVPRSFERTVGRLGGTVVFAHEAGVGVVEGLSPQAAAQLVRAPGVANVQPDIDASEDLPEAPQSPEVAVGVDSPSNPAGAFFYARQWNMRAIDADEAWAAGRLGSPEVTVAILDTGLDYLNVDLRGRVDLERSASFLPIEDQIAAAYFPTRLPFTDLGYHGTHVGATVASNGYVGAGVTSMTTLMAVKVCYGNDYTFTDGTKVGGCPGSAIFAGLLHAVDQGADVVNMSLGGSFSKAGNGQYIGYVNKLFNYARSRGVTVVVSAGNNGIDLDHDGNGYKTYCSTPSTVCVSATGPTNYSLTAFENVDAPADYTNFGRSAVNVAAPGGNESYVYAACSTSSLAIPVCQTGNYIVGLAGTSMAAPHVSGLAALLVGDYGRSPAQIKSQIQQSADDLGQRGTDPYYGKGRINVARALGIAPNA